MKFYTLFLCLWLLATQLIGQNLHFEPLENGTLQEDALQSQPVLIKNDSILIYITQRVNNLVVDYNNNFPVLYNNDTIQLDIYHFNLISKEKKKISVNKPAMDSSYLVTPDCIYFDDNLNKLYVRLFKLNDSQLTQITNYTLNQCIFAIDSTFSLVKTTSIPFNLNDITNPINYSIENDSILIAAYYDLSLNYYQKLTALNLNNFQTINNFILNDSLLGINHFNRLNDSTIVFLGKEAVYFLDNSLVLKSKKNYPSSYLMNAVPGEFKHPYFNKTDTTYFYHTRQMYPSTINEVSQLDAVVCGNGNRLVLTRTNHDSIVQATNCQFLTFGINNLHFYSKKYKYSVATLFDGNNLMPNIVTVIQTNENNQLKWKKYIGFDNRYINPNVIGTADSGCLIVINKIDLQSVSPNIDLYYIKLDKNGNQQENYLPLSLTNNIEKVQNDYVIYPNSFSNQLFVKSVANEKIEFTLFDIYGNTILQQSTQTNHKIEIPSVPQGAYLYNIHQKNKRIKSGILEKR